MTESRRDHAALLFRSKKEHPMKITAAFALAVLLPTGAFAQTSNLQDLSRLPANAKLSVHDDLANERQVRLKAVTPDGLEVWVGRNRSEVIPAATIKRVDEHRKDPIGRGLGIGLAVGGGLTAIGTVGCAEQYGYGYGECFAAGSLIYLLPGIGIGALIDALVKERVTVYQAPGGTTSARPSLQIAPLLARRGGGVRFAWAF
jgi:hypothetical protein